MDVDQLPSWLKALAASLWVLFMLVPLIVWLTHRFGDAAIWLTLPVLVATFWICYARVSAEDISAAEYYRRKARNLKAVVE